MLPAELVDLHVSDTGQGEQTLSLRFTDLPQTSTNEHSVFADQRREVCDGAKRHQIKQIVE